MKTIHRKTAVALIGTIVMCVGLGFGTVMFKGFVDFPCFVDYDEVNQCVMKDSYLMEADNQERIQVYLDTTQIGFSGAGCNMKGSNNDLLEVGTPVLHLSFERSGEALLVNGEELPAGEVFMFTKFWNLNPWTVYTMEFTNYGVVPICQSDSPSTIVVIGKYGNRVSLVKPVVVLVVLLGIILVLSMRRKPNQTPTT